MRVTNRVAILFLLPAVAFAAGPKLQVLHTFLGGSDGDRPRASLIADSQGNLYGTTPMGGLNTNCLNTGQIGCGVVFELSPPTKIGGSWRETILYRFTGGSDGAVPEASLIFDSAGNLYGTTGEGGAFDGVCNNAVNDIGCGVVFELSPQAGGAWTEKTLYAFTGNLDGASPQANVTFDSAGNLYGTTQSGGFCQSGCSEPYGYGVVFELTPNGTQSWTETTLYAFQGLLDGELPLAGVVFDPIGNIYGTSSSSVFELTPPSGQGQNWTFIAIGIAGFENSGIVLDSAGNLYGSSVANPGSVLEFSPLGNGSWNESTLYTFGGKNNNPVGGVVFDSAGNIYGPVAGPFCGGLYRLQNMDNVWTEAGVDFYKQQNQPCEPQTALIFGKWGALYGTTSQGGSCPANRICGTAFAIYP